MRIGIIGGGSLGLLLSSYLTAEHDVTLYVKRKQQRDIIHNQRIKLRYSSHRFSERTVNVALIDELAAHDILFICVKQFHIDEVIKQIRHRKPSTATIFLQNGMGHISKLAQLPTSVFVGVVEHGAHRVNENEVNHLGVGAIKLAPYATKSMSVHSLVQQLHQPAFPFESYANWQQLLHGKLLINAVINPLTALFDVPNGDIIANDHIRHLAKQLCKETAHILNVDYTQAWQNVQRVAIATKNNTSSMRADIIHHRQTEIDAISGYIIEKANGRNIPFTHFVFRAVLVLQERGRST